MLYTALRSFHAVASHGGFSSAARALNISQPTLSSQVKSLED
ncbi:MAG: LysR family transcriptional regulator, partial [Paracoccaceae bacterium]|nr:LysR family transcriptional regulator [Paracoccaceae bacterium]